MPRIAFALLFAAVCTLAGPPGGAAERYPERPIRLIAPYPPGGGVDLNARMFAELVSPALGQTILVDNRPGAGSRLGIELISKASPDGYTLGLAAIDMAVAAALYDNLPYDTLRDFVSISLLTEQPNILVAHPSLPAKSFQEFIALARARPGKLTYSTSGIGTGPHLATELLALSQKVELLHVPYKGTGPALTGLLGNEVSVSFSTFASALPYVKSERLRALAVTTRTRAKALPAVPTVAESGSPDYEFSTWYGLIAPARVPRTIVEHLSRTTVAVLNTPEARQRYEPHGLEPIPSTPAHYAAYLRSEVEKWTKVVRAAKIQLQLQ